MLFPLTLSPRRIALAALVSLVAGSPLSAQSVSESDLAALRYFLSIGDEQAVRAEKERLQEEFPDVEIDALLEDLTQRSDQVDTSQIWELIARSEYEGARELIARTRQEQPSWSPPDELLNVLNERQGQTNFDTAIAEDDLTAALATIGEFPDLLTCQRVNNAWQLAELQARNERVDSAISTYSGILSTCTTSDYVIATLQKASQVGTESQVAALFETARERNPSMRSRLADLESELAPLIGRQDMVNGTAMDSASSTSSTASRSGGPAPVTSLRPEYRGNRVAPARVSRTARDAPVPVNPAPAPSTGRQAPAGGGSLSSAAAAADREDWATCLRLTNGNQSAQMLSQRGWCAMNMGRPLEAIRAFQTAAANTGDAQLARDSNYGAILAYLEADMVREAADLSRRASLSAQQRQTTDKSILSQLALQSFDNRRYNETVAYVDRLSRETGGLDRGMAMLRGYALLHSGRKPQARQQFMAVHRSSPGPDSQRALVEAR